MLLLLLQAGCSSIGRSVSSSGTTPEQPEVEEADYGCAYFYYLWGRYAELNLRFPEALAAYEKALICDPGGDSIRNKIPLLLLRMERYEEAIALLETYLAETPNSLEMWQLLARAFLRQNKREQAIQQYTSMIDRFPESPVPRLLLGEVYYSSKQYEQAKVTVAPVLDMATGTLRAHLLLARINQRLENNQQAILHYTRVVREQWSAEIMMEIGKLHLREHQYAEATAAYQQILDRDRGDRDALVALFHLYQLTDNKEMAVQVLETLRTVSEYPWRVDLTLARVLMQQEQFSEAAVLLERILTVEELAEARYLLGQLYAREKKYPQALYQLEQIPLPDQYGTDALLLKVHVYQQLDRIKDAVELMENMVDRPEVRSAELFAVLAALYEIEGDQQQVAVTYRRGIAAFPESDVLLYEYGIFHENTGDRTAALKMMQEVIRLNPEHAAALNFVGYTWADDGTNLEQALEYIRKAVELQPDNGYIRDSLGWVYFRMGDIRRAIEELEKAVTLSPDDPAIYDHLGDAYAANAEEDKAIRAYMRAVELFDDQSEERDKVQEKMDRLQQRQ